MKIDRGTKRVSERREREGGTEYVRVWVHVLACDGRPNIVVSFKVMYPAKLLLLDAGRTTLIRRFCMYTRSLLIILGLFYLLYHAPPSAHWSHEQARA